MLITVDDIKERLEMLTVVVTDNDYKAIQFSINKIVKKIFAFCNIDELLDEMKELVADMICADFLQMKLATGQDLGENLEGVTDEAESIKEGDTTVTFAAKNSQSSLFNALLSSMLNPEDLKCRLTHYRRLKW